MAVKVNNKLLIQLERYLRLETVDKLTVVTSFLIVAGVVFALGTSAIFFLSNALVEMLSLIVGNSALAYLIVGVILLLMIWIFLANRKAWVENKIVRSLSESVLNEPMISGDVQDIDIEVETENGGNKG